LEVLKVDIVITKYHAKFAIRLINPPALRMNTQASR